MNEPTPTDGLNDIRKSLLAGLHDESERNPQFGVAFVASNASKTPLSTVEDLDKRIDFAGQRLEDAYLRLLSHVATAKKRRNTFLPISKLPVEILGAIFEMTCDIEQVQKWSVMKQRPNHVEHLRNLAAVSSQFSSVVMGTATLWAVADCRCSPSQVNMCLKKSQGASIAVKHNWRGEYKITNDRFATGWFDSLISEHVARWRDAELFFNSSKGLEMLPKEAAPQLQRIVVDTEYISFGEPIHLFGGKAPNLRILDLTRIHLHWEWDPGMIVNLRSLVLRDITISEATTRSFLSVIQLSSMLEKLVICDVRLGHTVNLTPGSPSRLDSLKEIAITRVPWDVSRYFIGTIQAPHVQSTTVEFWDQGKIEDWGQLIVSCLDNSILHHVEQALQIELHLSNRAARMSLFKDLGPPVLLNLVGPDLDPDSIGWLLENIVARRKQPTFSIRLSNYELIDHEHVQKIVPHLLRLQDVTKLEIESEGWEPLLEPSLLSRPVSETGQEHWLWPRLNSLTVTGSGWEGAAQDVLDIVEGRLEGPSLFGDVEDAAADEHERPSRPARIQTVNMPRIDCFSKATADQLNNLVRECQLPPEPPIAEPQTAYSSTEPDLGLENP
ncbi:hypothetical protein FRC01_006375 [Tulasnella sp. 417]|nr:hypothetical protein FRC01_006375 [Tulasnella sp. 417]